MNITKRIAKIRFNYHMNMIDFCNAANKLHLLSDEKTDQNNMKHFNKCLVCCEKLGYYSA